MQNYTMRIIEEIVKTKSALQDSSYVRQFQPYFGIEILHVCKVDSKKSWIPIEVSSTDNNDNSKDNGENVIIYKVIISLSGQGYQF